MCFSLSFFGVYSDRNEQQHFHMCLTSVTHLWT